MGSSSGIYFFLPCFLFVNNQRKFSIGSIVLHFYLLFHDYHFDEVKRFCIFIIIGKLTNLLFLVMVGGKVLYFYHHQTRVYEISSITFLKEVSLRKTYNICGILIVKIEAW